MPLLLCTFVIHEASMTCMMDSVFVSKKVSAVNQSTVVGAIGQLSHGRCRQCRLYLALQSQPRLTKSAIGFALIEQQQQAKLPILMQNVH